MDSRQQRYREKFIWWESYRVGRGLVLDYIILEAALVAIGFEHTTDYMSHWTWEP